MIRLLAMRQRFHRAPLQQGTHAEPLALHLGKGKLVGPLSGDDDEVDSLRQKVRPSPKAFAAEPFDPVSSHGVPYLSGNDEPQTRRVLTLCARRDEQRKMSGPNSTARSLRPNELRVPSQPALRPETKRHGPMASVYFL
jgi:hypothetical protein